MGTLPITSILAVNGTGGYLLTVLVAILKTTFAESQAQFDEAIDFFDWDRSRAWYMDIAGSKQDFIYAISKKNCKIFKHFITDRNHPTYTKGKEKYEDLAFKWWQLMV